MKTKIICELHFPVHDYGESPVYGKPVAVTQFRRLDLGSVFLVFSRTCTWLSADLRGQEKQMGERGAKDLKPTTMICGHQQDTFPCAMPAQKCPRNIWRLFFQPFQRGGSLLFLDHRNGSVNESFLFLSHLRVGSFRERWLCTAITFVCADVTKLSLSASIPPVIPDPIQCSLRMFFVRNIARRYLHRVLKKENFYRVASLSTSRRESD